MKHHPANVAAAWAGLLGLWPLAAAGSEGQAEFLETLDILRRQDPAVGSVEARIFTGEQDSTGCGPTGNAADGALVAQYCPRDRTIVAAASTIAAVEQTYGIAGLRYLAAHELAHGRQHAVTGFAKALVWSSVLDELQADCIAGAYLRRAFGYTVESAAAEPLQRFAYAIGDHSFYSSDWHGNPRWRVAALNRGLRTGDAARCLSSQRFNYGSLLERGASLLQQLRRD